MNTLVYKTPEEMEAVIDKYFEECKGEVLKDDDGNPILTKHGEAVVVNARPPTIAGLVLALGFSSKQTLYNYGEKKKFSKLISLARLRIEEYTEARLFDRDGCRGAEFSLMNNFGWNNKPKTDADKEALEKLDELIEGINNAAKS